MGFGEAEQQKGIVVVEFTENVPGVSIIPVPRFQELKTLRGDWPVIAQGIDDLKTRGSKAWLEIIYEGDEIAGSLSERLDEIIAGTSLERLQTKNNRVMERALAGMNHGETLDDLDVTDVFQRCLKAHDIPEEQQTALLSAYQEIIVSINEQDARQE
jgi:exonuclease SbcD